MPQIEVLTLRALDKQQANYTRIRLWGSLGFVLAVTALGTLFDSVSINYLPLILSLMLTAILFSSLFLPQVATQKRHKHSPQLLTIIKQPSVIGFFIVCFLLQASHGPYYTFFSVYLQNLGYSKQSIGGLWALGVVAEIILYLYMRLIFERFSLRFILCGSLLLTVLRWLIIGNFSQTLGWIIVAQVLHAFSFGAYHAVGIILVKHYFVDGNTATGMGLYSGVSFGAGGTLGAYLSGRIWDFSPWLCFSAAAVAALGAYAVAFLYIQEPQKTA